jgi:hypothetical protein
MGGICSGWWIRTHRHPPDTRLCALALTVTAFAARLYYMSYTETVRHEDGERASGQP